jgi:hypothetical protein
MRILFGAPRAVKVGLIGLSVVAAVGLSAESASARTAIPCNLKNNCMSGHKLQRHPVKLRRFARHSGDARRRSRSDNKAVTFIGRRPAGCPHQYCGCGLRKYLGLGDNRLNLAWNWTKYFPRTTAHPGAAAVRHHHVMLLVRHAGGSRWIVRDYNSGGGMSRIHEREVRGYVFVNPGRTRMASLR